MAVGRRGTTPVGRLIGVVLAVRGVVLVLCVVVLFALELVGVACWFFANFVCVGLGWRT